MMSCQRCSTLNCDAEEPAYVSYKTEDIDEETKKKYAKKLGGLSQYKRDVKNEAAKLWKANQL